MATDAAYIPGYIGEKKKLLRDGYIYLNFRGFYLLHDIAETMQLVSCDCHAD